MKWLRRYTTECEREAQRILNELDALHPDDRHRGNWKRQALMERLLEELTSPELSDTWVGREAQLNAAVESIGLRVVLTYSNRVTVEYVARPGHFWSVPIPPGRNLALCIRALYEWHAARMERQRLEAEAAEPIAETIAARTRAHPMGFRQYTCPTCPAKQTYSELLDRFYCEPCDQWVEDPCRCDPRVCDYAARQTAVVGMRPSAAHSPDSQQAMAEAVTRMFSLEAFLQSCADAAPGDHPDTGADL